MNEKHLAYLNNYPTNKVAKGWNYENNKGQKRQAITLEGYMFELLTEIAQEKHLPVSFLIRNYIEDGIARDSKHS